MSHPVLTLGMLLVAAYLLGSIPFSQVFARLHGVDLRTVGSGNVGASNLSHHVGWGWGSAAAVLDGLKGLVPVWLARAAGMPLGVAALGGLAAVAGHNWSVLLKGRAGRGLATSAGMLAALDPTLLLWPLGWAVAGWRIGGGIAGFIGWAPLFAIAIVLGRPTGEIAGLLLLAVILLVRRMQGNPGAEKGLRSALRRAVFDTEGPVDGVKPTEAADDLLTP